MKWREQYGLSEKQVYNYENFDSILNDPTIDVVYIVLPNSMHCDFVVRAAKAGKHVFCEKPMANTADECRKMIEACKTAKRQLGIGYRCQREPHHVEAIRFRPREGLRRGPARRSRLRLQGQAIQNSGGSARPSQAVER